MAWSYDKATDTLTVTGGTAEAPLTLDDFDGELDISADPIVIKDTTAVPEGTPPGDGYTGSADVQPVFGGNLGAKLYAVVTGTPSSGDYVWLEGKDALNTTHTAGRGGCGGTLTTASSGYLYWIAASQAVELPYFRLSEIFDSGITARRDSTEWSFKIEQREVQCITKAEDGSYIVHCNLVIGNGTDATYLASLGEVVRFATGKTLEIKSNATLRMGEASDSWGRRGSMWTVAPSASMDLIASGATNAAFEQYASMLCIAGNAAVLLQTGSWTARNAVTSGIYLPDGNTSCNVGVLTGVEIDWKRVQVNNIQQLGFAAPTLTLFEDVHAHGLGSLYVSDANITLDTPRITGAVNADLYLSASSGDRTVKVVDPVQNLGTVTLYRGTNRTATVREVYTCNMTLVDAAGDPIEGVTVTCYDKDENLVFEADTDENGAIAEQEIVSREWTATGSGTSSPEPTAFSPHKFTFERTGYETLEMDQVTVDSPIEGGIDWRVPMMEPAGGGGKAVNLGMQT